MQHPFDYLELNTGTLMFTPCPGSKGVSLSGSLGQLKAAGAAAVITLMPTHELEQNDAAHIGVICEELGMEWYQLPIEDDCAPEQAFETAFTGYKTALVALLQYGTGLKQRVLNIKLAAPTGKAAVRLTESISGALSRLPAELTSAIPTEVTTLHRLLGALPNRRSFKHHAQNPLQLDVLVVDEASMIDLEMMAALLDALPAQAQLVLLGDKDQLSSVEAGSVLGDLCRGAAQGGYHSDSLALLQPYSQVPLTRWAGAGSLLNQATVMLRHSHRFDANSGIGQLAQAVNRGDAKAIALFEQFSDISLLSSNAVSALRPVVVAGYRHYLQQVATPLPEPAAWARAVLQAYSQFQLLCALRSGDWGVEGLNEKISHWLAQEQLIQASHLWYSGRPVMLQRNNYSLGLMNGDIGICLTEPGSGKLRVVFQLADDSLK